MDYHEKGQVMPLGLVLLAFTMAGALMLFNTGQVATDKMKLANSADAAAYSGALWQARALNYQAYANRAMVANQVAIGQAVSLQSWMTYAEVTSEHIATALKPVPVINVVTTGIDQAVAIAGQAVSLGAKVLLRASNAATKALSLSQSAIHAATLANTAEIISVVASETDARFTTHSAYGIGQKVANAGRWLAFNKRYTSRDTDAMKERQQLIMDSRDEFTQSRNWDLFDFWMPSTPLSWHKLKRQGNTKLMSVKTPNGLAWEWKAKDTLSVHNKFIGFFDTDTVEVPVSWASSFSNSKNSPRSVLRQSCRASSMLGQRLNSNCKEFTDDNHNAEQLADRNVRSLGSGSDTLKPLKGYGGVRSFWVLSDAARSAEDARLTVRVEVSLPGGKVRDSDNVGHSGELSSPVVTAGNTLSSISAADVFYKRPQHHYLSSAKHEKANAYGPYWQVQLAAISKTERLLALGLRSGGATPNVHQSIPANTRSLRRYQAD